MRTVPSRTWRRLLGLAAVVGLALALNAAPLRTARADAATPAAVSSFAAPGLASPGIGLPLFHLLDTQRLTWNQSLTFGFTSGGPARGTAGLYTSSFGYRLAEPLHLQLDIGAHFSPGVAGRAPMQGVFVQGLSLDWRPSRNSFLRISYRDLRSPLSWGPYGDWSSSPFDRRFGVEPESPN